MQNNLKIEYIQWLAGRVRKVVRQQEKYSLVKKKNIRELDKNVTSCLFQPPRPLNSFCSIFQPRAYERASLPNQKHNMGLFLLITFVDLVRV